MGVITAIDTRGNEVKVNMEGKKVYLYNNKKKEIVYNCEVVENGKLTGFYTDIKVEGTVENVRDRFNSFGNIVAFRCAIMALKMPSEKVPPLFEKVICYMEQHQDEFFDEYGDWKKRLKFKEADLKRILEQQN